MVLFQVHPCDSGGQGFTRGPHLIKRHVLPGKPQSEHFASPTIAVPQRRQNRNPVESGSSAAEVLGGSTLADSPGGSWPDAASYCWPTMVGSVRCLLMVGYLRSNVEALSYYANITLILDVIWLTSW